MNTVIRNFKLKIPIKYQIRFHINRSQLKLITVFLQGEHLQNAPEERSHALGILVLPVLST